MSKQISLIFILLFLICSYVFPQKETYNWYYGTKMGLSFNTIDTVPKKIFFTDTKLWATDACASISDSNGKLLMYTNGDYVFNFKHDTLAVINDSLGYDTLGSNASQNLNNGATLVLPVPYSDSHYYVLHIIGDLLMNPSKMILFYTTFDMAAKKGQGTKWDNKKLLHKYVYP